MSINYKGKIFWISLFTSALVMLGGVCGVHAILPKRVLSKYLEENINNNGMEVIYYTNANQDWSGEAGKSIHKSGISFRKTPSGYKDIYFSLRYKGVLYAPKTGRYCIGTSSDDGSYVYLNGELIVNNGLVHSLKKEKRYLYLIKGHYLLQIDYFQAEGGAQLHFFWEIPGEDRRIVSPEYLYLLSSGYSQEEFNSAKSFYEELFKNIELLIIVFLFFAVCFFFAFMDLTFLAHIFAPVGRIMSRNTILWLFIICPISIFSNMEILNTQYWPWLYIVHLVCLYLVCSLIYAVLQGNGRSLGLKGIILFSSVYMTGYLFIMFRFPLKEFMNIEDLMLYFTEAERFLSGDLEKMHYPVLAYALFSLCHKIALRDIDIFIIIFTIIRFLFLIWLFYCFYSFSEIVKKPVYGFIFSMFFLLAPFNANWLVFRYDIIPVALFAGSLYSFYKKRYSLSYILNACGFLKKWFPIVAIPFMTFYLFRKKRYQELAKGIGSYIVILAGALILFSPKGFFSSFLFQADRGVMGESIFNLILAWFYGHQPQAGICRDMPQQGIFNATLLSGILFLGLLLVFTRFLYKIFFYNKNNHSQTVSFSCWATIVFVALNRVFSPQFILWIYAFLFVILLFKEVNNRETIVILLILGACAIINPIIPDEYKFFSKSYIYHKILFWLLFIIVSIKMVFLENKKGYEEE